MTRAELYALVWEAPLVHLARRLGISNTRLKRICDEYEIPVPPPGYWAKRAVGKSAEIPELPNPTPSIFAKINSALRKIGEIPLKIADSQIAEFDPKFTINHSGVEPEAASRKLHPDALKLRDVLTRAATDEHGYVSSSDLSLPAVRVTPGLVDRATVFVDRLIAAVHRRGHKVIHVDGAFRVAVAGEVFETKVYETRQSVDQHSATPGSTTVERRKQASGKLCLVISDPRAFRWSARNLVGQWYDRRHTPLEANLDAAVAAMEVAAQQIQYCRDRAHDLEARVRAEQARAERDLQELAFLERHSALYRQLLALEQFAAFLRSGAAPANGATLERILERISAQTKDIRAQLAPDRIAAEARDLNLFGDDAPATVDPSAAALRRSLKRDRH